MRRCAEVEGGKMEVDASLDRARFDQEDLDLAQPARAEPFLKEQG